MTRVSDQGYPKIYSATEYTPERCGVMGANSDHYVIAHLGASAGFWQQAGGGWEYAHSAIYFSEEALLRDAYQLVKEDATVADYLELCEDSL